MGSGSDELTASTPCVSELIDGFVAESDLERRVSEDPRVVAGLAWGKPRSGHPEGSVGNHVADLLRTIDAWGETGRRRAELRLISLLHDSLKGEVRYALPRKGPNHHAARARKVAERYTDDERLLAVIELHDRPYHIWKRVRRTHRPARRAVAEMLERIPDRDLLMRFVELDASTEGKDPAPVEWLRGQI